MMALTDKQPPQSIEAERSVLGAILLNPEAIAHAVDVLGPSREDVFYHPAHQYIYEAACTLFQNHEPVEIITLLEQVKADGKLEEVGGAAYIADLTSAVPTSANIRYYAKAVLEAWQLRRIIEIGTQITAEAYAGTETPEAIIAGGIKAKEEVRDASYREVPESLAEIAARVVDGYQAIVTAGKREIEYPTGIPIVDEATGGYRRGKSHIIAARPSVGKTALLGQGAILAARNRHKALFFSVEMDKESLIERLMLGMETTFDRDRINSGFLGKPELEKAAKAMVELSTLDIQVFDRSRMTLGYIENMVRAERAKRSDIIVFVDYLQLVFLDKPGRSRTEEITTISGGLKAIAKEHDIPVVSGVQLSRESEAETSGLAKLKCMKEGGAIEQDADVALILFQELNDKRRELIEKQFGQQDWDARTELSLAKHRNGRRVNTTVFFDKPRQRMFQMDCYAPSEAHRAVPEPIKDIEDKYGDESDELPF